MVDLAGFTLSCWRLWVRNFSSSIAACVRVVTASLARTQSGQHLTRLNVPAGRDGAVSGTDRDMGWSFDFELVRPNRMCELAAAL